MRTYLTKGMILLSIFFITMVSSVLNAAEKRLTPQQNEIFQRVLAGELNNRIHNKFWSLFTQSQIDEIRQNQEQLVEMYGLSIIWQKQIWMSIRDSYKSQTISKSADYETLKENCYFWYWRHTHKKCGRDDITCFPSREYADASRNTRVNR